VKLTNVNGKHIPYFTVRGGAVEALCYKPEGRRFDSR